ncbi:FecR family protein [Pedobacter sp. BS3]|uniref:FecR family protein n=1 Tax=Pedobacter sp. BS3 TaxID=2567937 RepID=UPI0011EC24FC|nr:FecR domain-containing protein [Pedobacter sp. BS3]TZF84601.1 FecR family protein [Pedobacter sp. BS3]
MNINEKRLRHLLYRYATNSISRKDFDELTSYIHQADSDPVLFEIMEAFWNDLDSSKADTSAKDKVYRRIVSDSRFRDSHHVVLKPVKKQSRYIKWYAAAAVIVIAISAGLYFYRSLSVNSPESNVARTQTRPKPSRQHAGQATLTLADGTNLVLDQSQNGTVAIQGNSSVSQVNGQLVYINSGMRSSAENLKNTVTTPRGAYYQLILPDGTKVWLNTASSLTYPVAFNDAERRVELRGEAYFEVAKAPLNPPKGGKSGNTNSLSFGEAWMPFIVATANQEVEVLGTHFNVNAYADDPFAKTTLLEGSVRVSNHKQQVIITPGEQAIVTGAKPEISVRKVDTEEAMAWKNGYFVFNNEDIRTVMKTISRWYNIRIEYQGDMSGKTFGGTISRYADLDKLLKAIELTGAIHFRVEDEAENNGKASLERRVIVMP